MVPSRRTRLRPDRVLICLAGLAFACDGGTDPTQHGIPASLAIANPPAELFDTEQAQLTAEVRDADGRLLDTAVTWTVLTATVVAVDDTGWVTALAPGDAVVEASLGDLRDTARISVLERMGFAFPVVGLPNRDFFLHNYVDLDVTTGVGDYWCGRKSYDGHLGTDIDIASFAVMDSGVSVVAAAPGVVTAVQDGRFDRSTALSGGGFGNYVAVEHRDGFTSVYGHLVSGSVQVAVGQGLGVGALLGRVGSSGNSDAPHLHFEVKRDGGVVDPFGGPCGAAVTQWADPLAYQDSFLLIGSGLTNQTLDLSVVKEPPAHVSVFRTTDGRVTMWVQLFNVRSGTTSTWQLFAPSGELWDEYVYAHNDAFSMSWWWYWHTLGTGVSEPGTWRVDYRNGGSRLVQHEFTLVGAGAATAVPGPGPASGVGGGTGRRPR